MKAPGFIIAFALCSKLGAQTANQAVLTFLEEPGKNNVDISLNVTGIGASSETSTISGTMTVQVNISPVAATTDEFTILSADARGTDVIGLSAGGLAGSYDLDAKDVEFTITTLNPPGEVTPDTGEFDASQYQAITTGGTLTGSGRVGIQTENISFDLTDPPFSGAGQGTGTITVTPGRMEGRRFYFDLHVELPVGIAGTVPVPIPNLPIPVNVTFDFGGTVEASGETFLDFPDYATWATNLSLPTDSQNAFDLRPSSPNYLYYALGFDPQTAPPILFEFGSTGITLTTASEIALDDLEIQWSDDLDTWVPVPANAMISGSSQMSFGDDISEAPTISLANAKRFVRLVRPTP